MKMEDLLGLADTVSPAKEERALQAIQDCKENVNRLSTELGAEEGRLHSLTVLYQQEQDRQAFVLLVRSEVIRRVSGLRSRWCKARTALEEAELVLDRVRCARREYTRAVTDA